MNILFTTLSMRTVKENTIYGAPVSTNRNRAQRNFLPKKRLKKLSSLVLMRPIIPNLMKNYSIQSYLFGTESLRQ